MINEIEITGSSITMSVAVNCSDFTGEHLHVLLHTRGDKFDLEAEVPGFHDAEDENGILRGYYSFIEPFEVEELIDGITAKKLHKRIRSCEFITDGTQLFAFGHQGAKKLLLAAMSAITGNHFGLHEFEYNEMSQTGDRFSRLKSVVLLNPKEDEVRQARLSGCIENYTDYNVVNKRNHGIKSISGMLDTPLGPMNVTVGQKGTIRLGVKRGMLITFDCLVWILDLILDKQTESQKQEVQYSGEAGNGNPADGIMGKVMDNLESPDPGMEKAVADFKKTVTKDGGSCVITMAGPGVEPRSVTIPPSDG